MAVISDFLGRTIAPSVALIDADIVLHRVGFTTEDDDFWIAKVRADEMLDHILLDTGVSRYELWLSDNSTNNFRYQIYPAYKANRTRPKPRHHEALKEYLIVEWEARFAEGMEADDYLGILQDEENQETIICSIDKDLKQIPGLHYDFVKKEWHHVSWEEATKEFYKQIIVGDVADNIPGAYGAGPVAAARAIDPLHWESPEALDFHDQCARAIRAPYYKSLLKEWGEPWTKEKEAALWGHILLAGRLLKIKRSFKEPLWGSLLLPLMEEYYASYTLSPEVVSAPFTEPTTPERNKDGCLSVGIPTETILAPISPAAIVALTFPPQSNKE